MGVDRELKNPASRALGTGLRTRVDFFRPTHPHVDVVDGMVTYPGRIIAVG